MQNQGYSELCILDSEFQLFALLLPATVCASIWNPAHAPCNNRIASACGILFFVPLSLCVFEIGGSNLTSKAQRRKENSRPIFRLKRAEAESLAVPLLHATS